MHLEDQLVGSRVLGGCEGKSAPLFLFYVSMYYNKGKDQLGKVANSGRGQLNRENEYFPVPVRA